LKQIILITDGCSNVGVSPAVAAYEAQAQGITVNVIGVVLDDEIGALGEAEIRETAEAGGGLCRIVSTGSLGHTIAMMTRQTMAATIQGVVRKELQSIMGRTDGSIADLPPEKRAQVVQTVDELTEASPLKVALLIDTSASMKPKLEAVREAAGDLMLSLRSRRGKSELAILHFPGNNSNAVQLDVAWTDELAKLEKNFYRMNMRGTTPTGPAILKTVEYMLGGRAPFFDEAEHGASANESRISVWDDYVV
jgi:Ca-activated chloride channel homolog